MKGDPAVLRKMIRNKTASQSDYVLLSLIAAHRDIKMEVKDAEYPKNGSKDYINGNVYYSRNGGEKTNRVVTIKKDSQSPSGYREF